MAMMRHQGTGGKIIIKRDADGHRVYFSIRDDNHNGSVIDIVQKRRRSHSFLPCSRYQKADSRLKNNLSA